MKLVINIPDYVKEQADDGKGEELGIPLWLAYEIANGTPLPKGHKIIDEYALQEHLALVPMEDRTYREAVEIIDRFPSIIEADKAESEG